VKQTIEVGRPENYKAGDVEDDKNNSIDRAGNDSGTVFRYTINGNNNRGGKEKGQDRTKTRVVD
jgi:hypothetical protein